MLLSKSQWLKLIRRHPISSLTIILFTVVFLLGMTRYSSPKPKPVFILFNEDELVANFTSNDNNGDQVQLNRD